jgi:hypothetical protein
MRSTTHIHAYAPCRGLVKISHSPHRYSICKPRVNSNSLGAIVDSPAMMVGILLVDMLAAHGLVAHGLVAYGQKARGLEAHGLELRGSEADSLAADALPADNLAAVVVVVDASPTAAAVAPASPVGAFPAVALLETAPVEAAVLAVLREAVRTHARMFVATERVRLGRPRAAAARPAPGAGSLSEVGVRGPLEHR